MFIQFVGSLLAIFAWMNSNICVWEILDVLNVAILDL